MAVVMVLVGRWDKLVWMMRWCIVGWVRIWTIGGVGHKGDGGWYDSIGQCHLFWSGWAWFQGCKVGLLLQLQI